MNAIQVFNNPAFGQVRTIKEGNEILFCGKDVAVALGYANPSKAVRDHCKDGGPKRYPISDSLGRTQEARFISEPDLYRLIVNSKLPNAQQFESWVFEEVLPLIRKSGMYVTTDTAEKILNDPDFLIRALTEIKEQRAENQLLKNKIQEDLPKVLFADAVSASNGTCLIGELAKMLTQAGFKIGQNKLFELLRSQGYLISGKRSDKNMPTQKSVDLGLFEIKETSITHSDGHITINRTPKVTGKGQRYFIERFAHSNQAIVQYEEN